ncbi:hypothetical protein SBDP1_500047 [Syntrophobacter sp. SbD1]|nr:hypothetical protein SBDP1_500047 [Syntrophobacter sp. SbD1]
MIVRSFGYSSDATWAVTRGKPVIPAIDNPAATQWVQRGAPVNLDVGIQYLWFSL